MELNERLKNLRQAAGLTQTQIAKKVHVSQQSYAKYENGSSRPSPETIAMFADIYGVSTDYILGRKHEGIDVPLINNDPELTAYLEELRTRPEQRMLMGVTKDATKEQIEAIVEFLTKLRGEDK